MKNKTKTEAIFRGNEEASVFCFFSLAQSAGPINRCIFEGGKFI